MGKGRKPKYQHSENIVDIVIRTGYRYGRCVKCDIPVKSINWYKHTHDQGQEIPSLSLNKACLDQIKTLCCQTIDREGQQFLNTYFPQGISYQDKEKYIIHLRQMLIKSLTTNPRLSHEYLQPRNIQEEEQPRQVSEEMIQEAKDMSQEIFQEKVEDKIIKETMPKQSQALKKQVFVVGKYKSKAQQQLIEEFLEDLFVSVDYEVTQQGIMLKTLINSYHSSKKADCLTKAFNPKKIKDHSLLYLLKQCFVCQTSICEISGSFRQCIHCRTRIHKKCINEIEGCFCGKTKIPPVLGKNDVFQQMFGDPEKIQQQKILSYHYQGIKDFFPATPMKKIIHAENALKKVINKRSLYYTSIAIVCSGKGYPSRTNALNDPFLTRAEKSLVDVYERYKREEYKAPVQLIQIGDNDYGIQAMEDIPALSLICEYACDILSMNCVQYLKYKDQVMFYANGKNSKEELVLAPYICSNWGPLLNHNENGNCASLRTVIDGRIRVLLYSKKKITKGQQLLYNYNAYFKEYHTSNFRDLKK